MLRPAELCHLMSAVKSNGALRRDIKGAKDGVAAGCAGHLGGRRRRRPAWGRVRRGGAAIWRHPHLRGAPGKCAYRVAQTSVSSCWATPSSCLKRTPFLVTVRWHACCPPAIPPAAISWWMLLFLASRWCFWRRQLSCRWRAVSVNHRALATLPMNCADASLFSRFRRRRR